MTTKLCELNSFHSNIERKKQMTSNMVYLKVQKWHECVLHVEHQKYRKTEVWVSSEVQFVGHVFHLWCNIYKFWSTRTGIKEALWRGVFDCITAELCKPVYWCGEWEWEKETERQDWWRAVKRFQKVKKQNRQKFKLKNETLIWTKETHIILSLFPTCKNFNMQKEIFLNYTK